MKIYNTETGKIVEMHLNDYVPGQEDVLRQIVSNYDYLNGEVKVTNHLDAEFEADQDTINAIQQLIDVDGDGEQLGWM